MMNDECQLMAKLLTIFEQYLIFPCNFDTKTRHGGNENLFTNYEATRSTNFFFFSPLDGVLVHHRVIPSITFADTQLYTWVEKGTVTVRRIAQEQNTMSSARAQAWTAQSGVEHTNHEATVPPQKIDIQYNPSLE